MKTIGLLGGMSWESTELYYRALNEGVKTKLGGLHSAKIAMFSFDFEEYLDTVTYRGWEAVAELLAMKARLLEAAGAELLIICANTPHKVATQVERAIRVPFLHIADSTGRRVQEKGITTVGLLGTIITMEDDFYRDRLSKKFGLQVFVPPKRDRDLVHRVIMDELVLGIVSENSQHELTRIINNLHEQGAQGVIEGCTELVMSVRQEHTEIPLFDTTAIHVEAALDMAFK